MQKSFPKAILLIFAFLLVSCTPVATTGDQGPSATRVINSNPTATPAAMPCTVLHFPTTPVALGAEFGARGHVSGPANAPVSIVVFSDYQCPTCAVLAASLKQIRVTHPGDVRFITINTPLSNRDKDALASQAVEAADIQGKFWEMHDLLFEKLSDWSALAPSSFQNWVVQQAASLGLDPVKFQDDFQSKLVMGRVQQAVDSTASQPISPPIFFVNGTSPYSGLSDFASLDTVVRMDALSAYQFSSCPAWVIDPLKQYVATLHTSKGDVVIQLMPEKAPLAVNNFISLVRSGWYDNITFFKVIPDLLVMTGDPSETGMGNAGYLFETEISASLHFDKSGVVAMDNSGPSTNGSRFFITLGSTEQLYGQYTVFGKVISGMDVLSALTPRNPRPGMVLPPGDKLMSVSIDER